MPQSRTVTGAAAGTSLALLADPVNQVSLEICKSLVAGWPLDSQQALARIVAAVLLGVLGILALARDRITEAIEDAELPELNAGVIERLVTSKVGRRLGLRLERKTVTTPVETSEKQDYPPITRPAPPAPKPPQPGALEEEKEP